MVKNDGVRADRENVTRMLPSVSFPPAIKLLIFFKFFTVSTFFHFSRHCYTFDTQLINEAQHMKLIGLSVLFALDMAGVYVIGLLFEVRCSVHCATRAFLVLQTREKH